MAALEMERPVWYGRYRNIQIWSIQAFTDYLPGLSNVSVRKSCESSEVGLSERAVRGLVTGADVVLGREEVEVLNACVNAKLTIKSDEEAIHVCEAIRKMNEEAVEKATEKVREEATEKATENTQLAGIKNLIKNLNLTAEQAMAALGIPEHDRARIAGRLRDGK